MSAPLTHLADDELALAAPRRLVLSKTSPVRTPGGKSGKQVLQLSMLLPQRIERFYEPFMGGLSMSILLIKTRRIPAFKCHASDICGEAVDFFQGIQSTLCETIVQSLLAEQRTHGRGSQELYRRCLDEMAVSADRVVRAKAFYVHNRCTRMGIRKFDRPDLYAPKQVATGGITRSHILRLPLFGAVLRQAAITHRCYSEALTAAADQGTDTCVFLDPPYEGDYDATLYDGPPFDFDAFADRCHAVKDRVRMMITINDSPANRQRFAEFRQVVRRVYYKGSYSADNPELVITNYQPPQSDYFMNRLGWELL